MGCGVYWQQIGELDRAMGVMRRAGISELSAPYQKLFEVKGKLFGQIGLKFPRSAIQLLRLVALSPGIIALWLDVEAGWMSEGRVKPGAPPVYHSITDEQAIALLTGGLTKELELKLLAPDPYLGE